MGKLLAIMLLPVSIVIAVVGVLVPGLPAFVLIPLFTGSLAVFCSACYLWRTNDPHWR